jgi:hypothetical protein
MAGALVGRAEDDGAGLVVVGVGISVAVVVPVRAAEVERGVLNEPPLVGDVLAVLPPPPQAVPTSATTQTAKTPSGRGDRIKPPPERHMTRSLSR